MRTMFIDSWNSLMNNADGTCDQEKDHDHRSSNYGWLEEIEIPEESHMDGIEYLGPQIIDN